MKSTLRPSPFPRTLRWSCVALRPAGALRAWTATHAAGRRSPVERGVARAVITPQTTVWLAGYGSKRPPDTNSGGPRSAGRAMSRTGLLGRWTSWCVKSTSDDRANRARRRDVEEGLISEERAREIYTPE